MVGVCHLDYGHLGSVLLDINKHKKPVPVAYIYNPSYSGGRDQEDQSSKPAWANSLWDPISKNPSQKRAGGVAQGAGPEFKLQYHKNKNKKQTNKQKKPEGQY
jgi:hypothetical protein